MSRIRACPECDGTNFQARVRNTDPNRNYYCNECGASFREPTERERHEQSGSRNGYHGKALADADPDDWP